jgi:hypothetical protein
MPTKEQYEREELERAASGLSSNALEAAIRVLRVAGSDPLRSVLLARILNALAHSTEEMGERALSDAAAAPSDYAVLLRVLQSPEVLEALSAADPLADARVRGLEARARLLEAEGGTLSADEVAALLGISREAVNQRRRAGRLLALSTGRRGYRYPAWQFGEEGVLPGFERALKELAVRGQWGRAAFFLGGNARLGGRRPLDLLRSGRPEDVEAVLDAARTRGEQIAD